MRSKGCVAVCCVPIASRPCSETFLTVHIPTFLYIIHVNAFNSLVRLEVSFSRRFSVKLMYVFNLAAIFLPGHPYIESTSVLSDNNQKMNILAYNIM